jgi:alpha-beta hydrolase superfamily lysophospholipase
VVFLHGAFADEACFSGWVEWFGARGFPAVAPARRGRHGVGPAGAAGLRLQDYVDDTLAVVDAVAGPGRPAPVLVGHSLGALLAQRLGAAGRASALVLLAPAPPGRLRAQPVALPRFAPLLGRILTGRSFVVGNGACDVLALNEVPEADRSAIHAHLTPESGRVYRSLLLGRVGVDTAAVTVPVHVAGGERDRIVSRRQLVGTARRYGATADVRAGRGHWIVQEPGWEDLAGDVLAWLHRCGIAAR